MIYENRRGCGAFGDRYHEREVEGIPLEDALNSVRSRFGW